MTKDQAIRFIKSAPKWPLPTDLSDNGFALFFQLKADLPHFMTFLKDGKPQGASMVLFGWVDKFGPPEDFQPVTDADAKLKAVYLHYAGPLMRQRINAVLPKQTAEVH